MEASDVFSQVQPFTGVLPGLPETQESGGVMTDVAMSREVAEVQGAMIIAKKFPRNQMKALDRILVACQRPLLAESALYSYAKGGTEVTGPSIRLAEAIAQNWGNISFGIRELEQRIGESTVESFAVDLETNTRQTKTFQVKHIRRTRAKGNYALEDPRDIYEMVANQGARRLRACILGVIPGDVVEAAQNQCEATLKAKADISPEAIKKMVEVFKPYGVTQEMVEARIQRKLDSITPAQVISLRKVFNSLKDGMSKAGDWFDISIAPEPPKTDKKATTKPKTPPAPEKATDAPGEGKVGTGGGTVGPRGILEPTLRLIQSHIERTKYELEILLQDYEVSALIELTEEAGQNALKFLATLPDVD